MLIKFKIVRNSFLSVFPEKQYIIFSYYIIKKNLKKKRELIIYYLSVVKDKILINR
jgi:hypothetical protein